MSSSPLPSTNRTSQSQFLSDLTQVFRRHKIPFGEPSDIHHLAANLITKPAFRADLFTLCTAISDMSENGLSAAELLELVARATTGGRKQFRAGDMPPDASSIFVSE